MRVRLIATPFRMQNGILVPTTRQHLAEQEKLARYATITAGMYAWQHDKPGECNEAGSGVVVAPGLVLTAKHVVNSMGGLDPRWDPKKHNEGNFDEVPDFDIRLYQAPRFDQPVMWYVKGSLVRAKDTDIAILPVAPEEGWAEWAEVQALPEAFVRWRLTPPPQGAEVELYGWPKPGITNTGEIHTGPVQWKEQTGIVTDVFPKMRTHGCVDYPSFRIERPVEGAFSGGPVFYNGALVGVTSVSTEIDPNQPDIIGDTYIASLWPLLLRELIYEGRTVTFGDLFDEGVIDAIDYADFRGKVVRTPCDHCLYKNENHVGHAEWMNS